MACEEELLVLETEELLDVVLESNQEKFEVVDCEDFLLDLMEVDEDGPDEFECLRIDQEDAEGVIILLEVIETKGVEEMPAQFSVRLDEVGQDVLYKGEANPGSSETAAVWRIRKITLREDGDVEVSWAEGTSSFDKTWSLRETYTYR